MWVEFLLFRVGFYVCVFLRGTNIVVIKFLKEGCDLEEFLIGFYKFVILCIFWSCGCILVFLSII